MRRALIIDCDGVLALSQAAHRGALQAAFVEASLDIALDEALYERLSQTAGVRAQATAYFARFGWPGGEAGNTALLDRIEATHLKAFRQAVRRGEVVLREGVGELIERASAAGWTLAVCGDDHVDAVMACLSLLGLQRASKISIMLGRSDVERGKPAPDIFLAALQRLEVTPQEALAIDDTSQGCAAALAAGLTVIAAPLAQGANPAAFPGVSALVGDLAGIDLDRF